MFLSNTTPLDARVDVAVQVDSDVRIGLLLAKATFRWGDRGEMALDGQHPEPLSFADRPTSLGLLPRDDLPDAAAGFELIVLGCAHAPDGKAVERRSVAARLGAWRSELAVTGDRRWEGEGEGAVATPPEPYLSMPIGWERAFGGSVDVEIDDGTTVPVIDARNPIGRGLDPSPTARTLAEKLRCPTPFPRWRRLRELPNVEHPDRLVRRWDDAPEPAGWGAVPPSWAISVEPFLAAPGCVLDEAPSSDARLVLEGLAPGAPLELRVPPLEVVANAAVGARRTSRVLRLARWVLHAEERWMSATYHLRFSLRREKDEIGSMRLRVSGGGA